MEREWRPALDVVENTISRLRRGTMGTSIQYSRNDTVIDISDRHIPNCTNTWYQSWK